MKSCFRSSHSRAPALPPLPPSPAKGLSLEPAPVQTSDLSSLQRGAKLFVNYCLNCHGASLMRYNRLKDIGLTDDQIRENLLFSADKVGETMTIAMHPKDAKSFFGATRRTCR